MKPLSPPFGFNPFCELRNGNINSNFKINFNGHFSSDAAHGLFFGSSLRISILPCSTEPFRCPAHRRLVQKKYKTPLRSNPHPFRLAALP